MRTNTRQRNRPNVGLGGTALLGLVWLTPGGAATLPPTPCTSSVPGHTACDLRASAGALTLPDATSVPVWGYSDASGGPLPAAIPGPVLIVDQGDTVTVTLTNDLAEPSGLLFQGQGLTPDTTGAAAGGGTRSYHFVATNPGTYLYEAAPLPNAQHQVAMGLYGALIVRPTDGTGKVLAGTAYPGGSPAPAAATFDDEALLVLGEVDPALNAAPAAFDTRNWAPKYFLINGKAYPQTIAIGTSPGHQVLLRYLNAGIDHHSMTLLGAGQTAVAMDGSPYRFAHHMVAETIAPGATADTLVSIPAGAPTTLRYPVYDASLLPLRNNDAQGLGGMLTFVDLGGGSATVAPGPSTGIPTLTPSPTNGTVPVALSAAIAAAGGAKVASADYFIDTVGSPGTGAVLSGSFGAPTATASATLSTATLGGLASGNHSIYVEGQDSNGVWGPTNFAVLNLDKAGPQTTGLSLSPNLTNGSTAVALSGTADDRATGNANVTAAEYFIDTPGANGGGTALTVSTVASVAGLSGSIPVAALTPLTNGTHSIQVHGRDALSNWGAFATVTLNLVRTGPTTTSVVANPAVVYPTTTGLNANTPAVRVTAAIASSATKVSAAEGFIDTVGANGTGFIFIPTDGAFNSASEAGYGDIPIAAAHALTPGQHLIYVHGQDAAGNWGTPVSGTLTVYGNALFADSFAAGNFSAWNGGATGAAVCANPGVCVTSVASLNGTPALGLQARLSGTTAGYVTDNTPVAEPSYHARFYFNPHGALPGTGQIQTIFAGLNGANAPAFQVQYQRLTSGGGTYQVRLSVQRTGGATNTGWFTVTNNAAHYIEIAWQAGSSATASLYTDGVLRQALSGLNTSAYTIESVRLGPSAGLVAGASGTLFFDAFASTRNSYIGP